MTIRKIDKNDNRENRKEIDNKSNEKDKNK